MTTGKAIYGVEDMGKGCLAGLSAITASCNVVRPWAAIIIGAVSGGLYLFASKVSVNIKLDDPLDTVAVHAWNGLWGILAAGLFSDVKLVGNSYLTNDPAGLPFPRGGGLFYSGGPGRGRQLAAQVVYAIWVAGWVLANMVRERRELFAFFQSFRGFFSGFSGRGKKSVSSLKKNSKNKNIYLSLSLRSPSGSSSRSPASSASPLTRRSSASTTPTTAARPTREAPRRLRTSPSRTGPLPTSKDIASLKSELAELKAAVAKATA